MTDRPIHTDLPALAMKRARADFAQADFLHRAALDEVQFRLSMVNRTFTDVLIVTAFPQIWAEAFPTARVIAPDETLDIVPGAHDLVIHAMALHWSNDIVGQLIQSRKALKADGLFLGVMLGGESLHQLRAAMAEAEVALYDGLSPRIAMMSEIRDIGQLIQRSGFALPVVDKELLTASYETLFHLAADLRRMGETNALALRKRKFERRALFMLADEIYRRHFSDEDGRLLATFELLFLTGWAPDDSQPKPLRPGSATARLADALKTDEHSIEGSKALRDERREND